jgi:mRNA interferase MazF
VRRGEIWLAPYPFASGTGSKKRPVLIVQCDKENQRLLNTIGVQITSNMSRVNEPTHLLIENASVAGKQSGLLTDSLVSCLNIVTIEQSLVIRPIGSLPAATMTRINDCLREALGL